MTTATSLERHEKGDIGEAAFESALRRLGFKIADVFEHTGYAEPFICDEGYYERPAQHGFHDAANRAIEDFRIRHTTIERYRDAHIDVKCHDTWHWMRELQTWQAGVGSILLREYQSRALEASQVKGIPPCSAHVVIIKRGLMAFGNKDGLPLPHHPSPAGVWIASVDDMLQHGFERYIPNEKGIAKCSTRAIDGGVWHPFAPWCETTRTIIVRRSEDPIAWDAFFASETPAQQVVLP